jgi:hypothetical protein
MDGTRFDQLIKSMATTRVSRLTALRGLAVGAVAAIAGMDFGAEDAEAAKSRRCRSKPTECQTCKKGKCHRNNNGQKKCRRGKLRPKANGTLCSIGTCQNSVCTRAAVGCSPATNTRGSCPEGQICSPQAICVAGCTGPSGTRGSCPSGQTCVIAAGQATGQCQGQGFGCTQTENTPNTRGSCPEGQVCNEFFICVAGCTGAPNRGSCNENQICCPSGTTRVGECRGNLTACQ